MDDLTAFRAKMPLHPYLFAIRFGSLSKTRALQRFLVNDQTHRPLPSLGRQRIRPGAVIPPVFLKGRGRSIKLFFFNLFFVTIVLPLASRQRFLFFRTSNRLSIGLLLQAILSLSKNSVHRSVMQWSREWIFFPSLSYVDPPLISLKRWTKNRTSNGASQQKLNCSDVAGDIKTKDWEKK